MSPTLFYPSLIYRKTKGKDKEQEEEVMNGTNTVGIQTLDKKEASNVLQLEDSQVKRRRPR